MQPPSEIEVDGRTITVKVTKLGRFKEGYGVVGDYKNNRIRLSPNAPTEMMKKSLFSELLHHCFDRSGLRDNYSMPTEEFIVHELEPWLWLLLAENPALLDYLFGR